MFSLKRNSLLRFEKLVSKTTNTGHLMIRAGFESAQTQVRASVLEIWDARIGTGKCTCRSVKKAPELLLATSIISHESFVTDSVDFYGIDTKLAGS